MVARPTFGLRSLVGIPLAAVLFSISGLSAPSASASSRAHPSFVARARAIQSGVVEEINSVRRRFGLASGEATVAYQSVVTFAARTNNDPVATIRPGTVEEYGVWEALPAKGLAVRGVPHAIVNNWVYHDGWKSSQSLNLDCTAPRARGCNDHRRAILSHPPAPNAHLYIDVDVTRSRWHGALGLSVATLLVWRT